MRISYHNHTNWSDGLNSLDEMIAGARAAGLDEFGISDHYCLTPRREKLDWIMYPDFLPEYVALVGEAIAAEHSNLIVRMGVEADYFPETVETVKATLAQYPFDYIIGSVHFVNDFLVDKMADDWEPMTQDQRNEVWRLYWVRMRELAESGLGDIVGHLDLPKKFGYFPTIDQSAEMYDALDAIAAADLAIEINTAGWKKPIHEAYPSPALLRETCRRGIKLVINADAHRSEDVASDFDRATTLAREAGYTELVRFSRRERFSFPL